MTISYYVVLTLYVSTYVTMWSLLLSIRPWRSTARRIPEVA